MAKKVKIEKVYESPSAKLIKKKIKEVQKTENKSGKQWEREINAIDKRIAKAKKGK